MRNLFCYESRKCSHHDVPFSRKFPGIRRDLPEFNEILKFGNIRKAAPLVGFEIHDLALQELKNKPKKELQKSPAHNSKYDFLLKFNRLNSSTC